MLNKLIKYDFKWINKVMYIYFIIMFLITIAVKIIESLEQTLFLVIVDKIASGMFIGCAISIIITCIMRIWSRFIQNVYKDESYLTHTLPVTKNEIFNSKIISSIISLILSSLVILICIAFIYLNDSTIETIKVMYESLVDVYNNGFAILFIIGIVMLILLEIIYLIMTGIFGIIVGHRFNNHKIIKSIIVGIVSYGVLSVVSLIILGILSQTANFEIVASGFPDIKTIKTMGITSISIYLVYDLLYYFAAKALLNKGVNVE